MAYLSSLNRVLRMAIVAGFCVITQTSALAYDIPKSKKLVESEDVEILNKISKAVSTVAQASNRAIAFVSVSKTVKGMPFPSMPFEFFFGPGAPNQRGGKMPDQKQQGLGSGFVIDLSKGYVLTNNHVVADADEISLKLANGQTYEAKVVGKDKNTDVAVVQIKDQNFSRKDLGELTLADSDQVRVGDFVIALGAPFGLESSLSFGTVSALGRGSLSITELGDFIQTDAAINPGNSGGPLLNTYGEVIGINTAIFSKSGAYNGIGFAIPANLVRTVAEQLINEGSIKRGFLGVQLRGSVDPETAKDMGLPENTKGALVAGVEPSGPAAKAGFEPGDVIVELNGKAVEDDIELRNRIGLMKPGSKVNVKIFRNGKKKDISATLANYQDNSGLPDEEVKSDSKPFGMSLSNITRQAKEQYGIRSSQGALVTQVEPDSSADRAGIQPGDVIVKVNNSDVKDPKDFIRQISDKQRVYLRIEREGREQFVPLRR
jgi:serine protease Do